VTRRRRRWRLLAQAWGMSGADVRDRIVENMQRWTPRPGEAVRIPAAPGMGGGEWTWDGSEVPRATVVEVNGDSVDVELPSGEVEPFDVRLLRRLP